MSQAALERRLNLLFLKMLNSPSKTKLDEIKSVMGYYGGRGLNLDLYEQMYRVVETNYNKQQRIDTDDKWVKKTVEDYVN